MKSNFKKILIYIRYLLPIPTLLAIFGMLFVPAYRFAYSGTTTDRVSTWDLLLSNWESTRTVLFGTAEATADKMFFSWVVFPTIIIFAILFLLSLAVSVWSAVIAFICFLSNNEESAERDRKFFCVFIPNRIVLTLLTSIGGAVSLLPHLLAHLNTVYSIKTTLVLEAPDALIIGGTLILCVIVLSIVCARFERAFDADIFKKEKPADESSDDISDDDDDIKENIDYEANARIRSLFDKSKEDKK